MRRSFAAIALTVTVALLGLALASAGPARQAEDEHQKHLAAIFHNYPMSPTPTRTHTAVPTNTPTATNTRIPTATFTPSNTPTATLTRTPTRTPTLTPTRDPNQCAAEYPTVCIPPPPPDLNCPDITFRNFLALPPDRHNSDTDNDQIGCEQN
jgi:hypothetical protein